MVWISCREAIDRRLFGDIRDYGQDLLLPFEGTLSPKIAVLLNLLFLGLLSPFTLRFGNIPVAENLRSPTQRIPQEKQGAKKLGESGMAFLTDENKKTWKKEKPPDITYWQKFKLFWQAPLTLFYASMLLRPKCSSHQFFDLCICLYHYYLLACVSVHVCVVGVLE